MWMWEADGDAKAVIVMIHGALEHHQRYGWLIEKWRTAGFHIIMGDLPGQGMTSRTNRGHIQSFEDYLLESRVWVESAYGFGLPVFLLGHSMGGLISTRLLQEERLNIAGIILSSPCFGLVHRPSKGMELLSRILNHFVPTFKVTPGITLEQATRNLDVIEADSNDNLYLKKISVRWYWELVEAIKQAFAQIEKTPDIPMLLMQAGDDLIVDKKAVKEWFNHVPLSEKRYKEWPNCYHEIFNEPERDEIFEYTKDFVMSQLKAIGYVY
ncbi:alpha/beta hydrolase [Bacillus sp. B15-48]|uniref:alpha/beta hydrolase n=1 Tax=Bacillus sp. B15-48 TaxID=1548601 RepID=UPI00193EE4D3|nr:alpha/beta hydrolase [Bacillus sp. B15-48]MBM4762640.1 alpha/beta fold hydrolase [Bacillus sp. B15-48]